MAEAGQIQRLHLELETEAEAKFRTIVETALDAVVLADFTGTIISWNPGAEATFGYSEEEVLGQPITILIPERLRPAHLESVERLKRTGERRRIGRTAELSALHKDGHEFPVEISLGTWTTAEGRYFCGIIRDVTERKELEEAFRHAALHDAVTKLPNRVHFSQELRQAADQATKRLKWTAVMMIDLDDFKLVNDRYGHQAGDSLLTAVGERLAHSVRAEDTVARFGGDEFVVLLESISKQRDVEAVAARITEALRQPYVLQQPLMLQGQTIRITASVGIALKRGPFVPEEVLHDADSALYVVKANGKGAYYISLLD